ncbi:MAG: 16S rRNA (guanine(966)-N(2))-methyltransferase RsmD [Pseudomonadota bacterium]|nr:16S rRNA (guanine(966)-N(2))-methyltransferase RsmD [Pseudomonadota bacterium]
MRIVAGEWRGRPLLASKGLDTRPTADRTRETLFSMLTSRLGSFDGLRVADLYAGSGALAFEALSRGAAFAVLVENDRAALTAIEANAVKLGATGRIQARAMSAARLPRESPFDLILADPPYAAGAGSAVAQSVADAGWLAPGGWLSIETASGDDVAAPPSMTIEATRTVGRARLTLLRG